MSKPARQALKARQPAILVPISLLQLFSAFLSALLLAATSSCALPTASAAACYSQESVSLTIEVHGHLSESKITSAFAAALSAAVEVFCVSCNSAAGGRNFILCSRQSAARARSAVGSLTSALATSAACSADSWYCEKRCYGQGFECQPEATPPSARSLPSNCLKREEEQKKPEWLKSLQQCREGKSCRLFQSVVIS